MLSLLQDLFAISKTKAALASPELVSKFAGLAGISVLPEHAELLVDVLKNENGALETIGDWMTQSGNPARAMKMLMGQDGAPQVCRCPHCKTSFLL